MPPSATSAALASWSVPPLLTVAVLAAAVLYGRGWWKLHRQAPARFPLWRLGCYLGGLACLWVAVASPLDGFAGMLLQVHMVQHILLLMGAPPLLLLGSPFLPLLCGLPRAWVREGVGPWLTAPAVRAWGRRLTHPLTGLAALALATLAWHLPPMYEHALRSPAAHSLEHASFVAAGLLFWWPIVQPFPSRRRMPEWAAIPYLLAADLLNTALSAFLSFYDRPLYPTYTVTAPLLGRDPLHDQAAAGALMWVVGSIGYLVPAGLIAIALLSPRPAQRDAREKGKMEKGIRRTDEGGTLEGSAPGAMGLRLWHVRRGVQMALLVLAAAVIWDGLAGPQAGALNLAGVLPWTYWRGLGILALLLVGNLVCSGCPFVLARDLARRWRAPRRLWPRALRTKWIPVGLVLLYLVAYEAFALWDWPAATAVILLGYFAAAILIDTSFRGASFCQYVCPVGQFQFVQSLVSPTEIRARSAAVCSSCRTHDCLRGNAATGARGCELNLLVPAKSGNMDCTLCLDCVRACPHENVVLAPVLPGADLAADRPRSTVGRYSRRPDLAALIAVLVFGSFANAAFMVAPVVAAIDAGNRLLGWSGPWLGATCLGLALTALPFAAVAACVGASGVRPGLRAACRMMPALVPLGAGMWAAHFFFHLATGWSSLGVVVARGLGWTDWRPPGLSPWWADALLPIELVFLGSGLLVTWVIIWRLASAGDDDAPAPRPLRRALPWAVLALALEGFGVWILLQPMEMRGTLFAG